MEDPTSRRKAYRLKGEITRDAVLTWDMNHRSFCRQFPEWRAFLPGGTRASWKSYNEDQSRGIIIMKAGREENTQETDEVETNKVRTALEDFLTCLGTYCPENFMFTVIKEATSYEWVLRSIHETFQLDNRGVNFLSGFKVKTESGEAAQTYQQRFQACHEFYSSSLLKKGEMDTNAEDRSRAYVTGPDFILNYLFLSCRGTGPIFV